MGDPSVRDCERLILLARKIAREEAGQIIDEHLSNCMHQEKPAEETDLK